MLNVYKLRKWGALSLMGFLPAVTFAVMALFYSYWLSLGSMFVTLLVTMFLGNLFLKNPFTEMLEGKGILALDINSTGIIKPFVVGIDPPLLKGQVHGKEVTDVYDRESTHSLQIPTKASKKAQARTDGGVNMPQMHKLDAEAYNNSKFAIMHYPVLIYNSAIGSFLTKQALASQEKETFAEQTIIFLNKRIEELTLHVKHFGRAVVEQLRPGYGSILTSKWTWIIIAIAIILIVIMFIPGVSQAFGGFFENAQSSVANAAGQSTDKVVSQGG